MASTLRLKRRASGGAAGAPAALKTTEPAYNEVDDTLYIGFGNDGSANATSIIPLAGKGAFVDKTSAQTVAGVKTFSSSPIVPTPTTDMQTATKKYVDDSVENAGGGDMLKASYDENDDGKVDAADVADAVPWTGVIDKPTEFPPETHEHAAADVTSGTFHVDRIPSLDAAKIGSGAFDAARIPSLPASKVTSGEFDTARIPALDAAKITTGALHVDRIPDLDAGKITTGTIDPARLPTGVLQAPIVSSGAISALDSGQQAAIVEGSTVTTSDGRMWMYKGSGSKTVEGSYVELADVTPAWSAIAGKPTFHAVAESGDYDDLDNLPTLGSLAAQDADDVAITGGAISGVTLDAVVVDGGTF